MASRPRQRSRCVSFRAALLRLTDVQAQSDLPHSWQPSRSCWSGRPTAVTGATGFLGAHWIASCVELGSWFNFSLEQPCSVLEVVERLQAAARTALEPDIRSAASNEFPPQMLSASLARSVLDWEPTVDLDEAFPATTRWYRASLASGAPASHHA